MADKPPPLEITRLIELHHAALYRYAYRLTGSVQDAEDLTQQVFLVAQAKGDQIRSAEGVQGWLFTVLRNAFLKQQRRPRPLPASPLLTTLEELPEEAGRESLIEPHRLQVAINELPEEFRVVLLMFYFEERSYREIATLLELPIGTVMSRLSRAKGHLRVKLIEPELETATARSQGMTSH